MPVTAIVVKSVNHYSKTVKGDNVRGQKNPTQHGCCRQVIADAIVCQRNRARPERNLSSTSLCVRYSQGLATDPLVEKNDKTKENEVLYVFILPE